MQLFINNWSAVLTAPATVSAVQLSVDPAQAAKLVGLGSGDYYLLTLAFADAGGVEIEWETVKVTAASSGEITVVRGQEGTTAIDWAAGVSISGRVTANTLAILRDTALAGGGSQTIIGAGYPDAAPPAIGAHYIFENAAFIAIGDSEPEHWVQLSGAKNVISTYVQIGSPRVLAVERMTRLLDVSAYGVAADDLPVVEFTMPAWRASPSDISLIVSPAVPSLTANIDLAFGAAWDYCDINAAPSDAYSVTRSGNTLSLSVTEAAKFSLHVEVYAQASGYGLYVELRASSEPRLVNI